MGRARGMIDRPTGLPCARTLGSLSCQCHCAGCCKSVVLYERDGKPPETTIEATVPTQKHRKVHTAAHPGPDHTCASVRPQPDSHCGVRANEQ